VKLRQARGAAAQRFHATGRPASSTPWRKASWCALDLELTGLNPRADHIIAVGIVPIESGRVAVGHARYTLVATDRPSNPDAVLAHKLRVADLAGAPALDEALDVILEELTGRVPVFHVAAVERAFLAPLLKRRRVRLPDGADTESIGRLWLGERAQVPRGGLSLERLAQRLGQRAEAPHHALADALTTAQAFIALASHLDAVRPQTVGSLIAAGEPPPGTLRFR
jgi:DNA polymerase-3 subunit epsilon